MYHVIAMEREYASGGNAIGKRTARELGYSFYDRNILVEAAKRLGIPPAYVETLEETSPGSTIFNLSQTPISGMEKKFKNLPLADQLFLTEKEIIEEAVGNGNCVIIGRCASYLLRDLPDCLRVFVYADRSFRLQRAIEVEKIAPQSAEDILLKTDKRRRSFFERHTKVTWDDHRNFDCCLNSGALGIDACVDLLCGLARRP